MTKERRQHFSLQPKFEFSVRNLTLIFVYLKNEKTKCNNFHVSFYRHLWIHSSSIKQKDLEVHRCYAFRRHCKLFNSSWTVLRYFCDQDFICSKNYILIYVTISMVSAAVSEKENACYFLTFPAIFHASNVIKKNPPPPVYNCFVGNFMRFFGKFSPMRKIIV